MCCLADGSDLLSVLAWAQVDAALHQALLEATGIVDDPAAAAAPGREAEGGAAAGAAALVAGGSSRRLHTRISFENFLGMLHDPSGVQDLEGFDDRWVGGESGGTQGSPGGVWCCCSSWHCCTPSKHLPNCLLMQAEQSHLPPGVDAWGRSEACPGEGQQRGCMLHHQLSTGN